MQAQASGITIRLRFGEGANEMVLADSVRIKQILGNLIRNAIIHSRCSAITVTYRSSIGENLNDRTGVWSITDNGIGIAPEEVERLFQPFQRGGEDARNRADGSGLGLYIVRTTAQLLGGSVTYFPAPEGGAGYHVRIAEPLASAEDLRQVAHMDDNSVDFSAMYVLLAEDNALVAEVTSARLRKFMGRVEVVGSGRAALDLIAVDPPDVVVTDLFMPEMSGDELTRTLRANGFTKPIIGLTAAVVGDDMRQFEKAGASTVMTKPLDDTALMRFLRKVTAEQDDAPAKAE
jgi:CheY-like chemotaxis protein